MPRLWREYLKKIQGRERKSALTLLSEIVDDGNAALCEDVLAMAGEFGRTDADSIRQCYYMLTRKEYRPKPLRLTSPAPVLSYNPNLSAYDGLTGGEHIG